MRPITSQQVITDRLESISFLLQPENQELARALAEALKGIRDLPRIMSRIRAMSWSIHDWAALFESVAHALRIRELVRHAYDGHAAPHVRILSQIVEHFDESLEYLVRLLNSCIDFDESTHEQRLIPKSGVDTELDEYRATFAGLDHFLTLVGKEEFERCQPLGITSLKIVYYPQLGFQVALPLELAKKLATTLTPENSGFEHQFHTEHYVYFKNARVRELDSEIGGSLSMRGEAM